MRNAVEVSNTTMSPHMTTNTITNITILLCFQNGGGHCNVTLPCTSPVHVFFTCSFSPVWVLDMGLISCFWCLSLVPVEDPSEGRAHPAGEEEVPGVLAGALCEAGARLSPHRRVRHVRVRTWQHGETSVLTTCFGIRMSRPWPGTHY